MHAINADQQNVLDSVTLAEIVVGVARNGMKRAEQNKTQRKNSQTKFQSDSPLWTHLPGSANTEN
jgi:phosphodiesterase/alkaline phosphatase D-like protein